MTTKELEAMLPTMPVEQRIEAIIFKYVSGAVSSAHDGETPANVADAKIAKYLVGKMRPWLTADGASRVSLSRSDFNELMNAIRAAVENDDGLDGLVAQRLYKKHNWWPGRQV